MTTYQHPLIARRNPDAPALWVGCLAAYNAGTLHGEWVQVSPDPAELAEATAEILAASPIPHAEEWDVMDTDGLPRGVGSLRACEYVAALEALEEGGYTDAAGILWAWVDWRGADDLTPEHVAGAYLGQFESVQDYAEQYAEDADLLREVPESLRSYFDWAAFARDLEISGDVYHGRGGHTFDGHA